MSDSIRRVAVVGGVRIPFCRSNTLYADLDQSRHETAVLDGLADKYGLEGEHIDEVVGGAVVTHSKDWNIAREAVIGSKLGPTTPGITMIQACGTSLQAAMGIAGKIAVGEIESGIGIRLGHDVGLADRVLEEIRKPPHRDEPEEIDLGQGQGVQGALARGTGAAAAFGLRTAHRPQHGPALRTDGARVGHYPRQHQDKLAYESHMKAAAAYRDGFMDDLLVPCAGVFRDNNLARGHRTREDGDTAHRLREVGARHVDGRQFDTADRRRRRRAARVRRLGAARAVSRSSPT